MLVNALTDARVRGLPVGHHTDGENLMIRVSPHLVRTWFYRYKNPLGKMQSLTLGRYPQLTLAGARDLKEKCKQLIADGLHPRLCLEDDGPKETFKDVAEMFIKHHEVKLKDGGGLRSEIDRNLTPHLGNMKIVDIKPMDVLKALEPMISRGSYIMARKVSIRAKQVVSHAQDLGIVNHNQLLNVTRIIPTKERGNMRALKPAQLPDLVRALDNAAVGMVVRSLARFALLTASRASEAAGMRWSEVEGDVWVIPSGRMKRRKEHRVPLSVGALAELEAMKTLRQNDYVFPGRSIEAHVNASSVNVALKRYGLDTTFHGFRALFATYCSERSKFSTASIEHSLAHTVGNSTFTAYTRTTQFDERVELLEWWWGEVQKAGRSATE